MRIRRYVLGLRNVSQQPHPRASTPSGSVEFQEMKSLPVSLGVVKQISLGPPNVTSQLRHDHPRKILKESLY
jgi:hypothetical protein